jgi:uncharacterized protein YnzC (UPF0291/DUF896 family)
MKIFDSEGNDVTYQYRIEKSYGTIKVTPRPIEITVESIEKKYDGKPLISSRYALTGGTLVELHSLRHVYISGIQVEPGVSEAWVSNVVITDKRGEDVSRNYTVSCIPGELRVIN